MNAQYTRMLVEASRAALASNADEAASRPSGWFAGTAERDRELRARERIRREIVREHFDDEPDVANEAKPAFAGKLARLLRLS